MCRQIIFFFLFGCYLTATGQINPALLQAIKDDDATKVAQILKATNLDVNAIDENGATPMLWACYKADLPIVKMLYKAGAKPRCEGVVFLDSLKQGFFGNVTGAAAALGKYDLLTYLIEELKFPLDEPEYDYRTSKFTGWTPLQWSARYGQMDITKYLVSKDGDVNVDQDSTLLETIEAGHFNIAKFLIENGVKTNTDSKYRAVHYALLDQSGELLSTLIKHGANINFENGDTLTPLDYAILVESERNLYILLANNTKKEYIEHALILAQERNLSKSYRILDSYLNTHQKFNEVTEQSQEDKCAARLVALSKEIEHKKNIENSFTSLTSYFNKNEYCNTSFDVVEYLFFKWKMILFNAGYQNRNDITSAVLLEYYDKTIDHLKLKFSHRGNIIASFLIDKYTIIDNLGYQKDLFESLDLAEKYLKNYPPDNDHSFFPTKEELKELLKKQRQDYEFKQKGSTNFSNTIFEEISSVPKDQIDKMVNSFIQEMFVFFSTQFDISLPPNTDSTDIFLNKLKDTLIFEAKTISTLESLYETTNDYWFVKELGMKRAKLINQYKLFGELFTLYNMKYSLTLDVENIDKYLKRQEDFLHTLSNEDLPTYNLLCKIDVMQDLANHFKQQYRYEETINLLEKSQELINLRKTGSDILYARNLQICGSTLLDLGMYREGLDSLIKAYNIFLEHEVNTRKYTVEEDLALAYRLNQDFEKALPLYQKSIFQKGSFSIAEASNSVTYLDLAWTYYHSNQRDSALHFIDLYEKENKVLNIESQHFWRRGMKQLKKPYILNAYGKKEEALAELEKILKGIRQNLEVFGHCLTEREKVFLLNFPDWSLVYNILADNKENAKAAEIAYNMALTFKSFALKSQLDFSSLIPYIEDYELQQEVLELQVQKQNYYNTKDNSILNNINELNRSIQIKLLDNLTKVRFDNWEDIKRTLQQDEAAVEIIQYKHFKNGKFEQKKYLASMITPNESSPIIVEWQDISSLETILDDLVTKTEVNNTTRKTLNQKYLESVWSSGLDSLLQAKNVKKIYMSLDNQFHRVPISAIKDANDNYLSEKYTFTHVISTRALTEKNNNEDNSFTPSTAIVIGGLSTTSYGENASDSLVVDNFNIQSNPTKGENTGFLEDNTEMRKEGINIHNQFENAGIQSYLCQNEFASKKQVKNLSGQSPDIIHFSTHGYYDVHLEKRDNLTEKNNYLNDVYFPLFKSYVKLAGANCENCPDTENDGKLTAYEVSQLDLSNTELVVLSACKSNLGDIVDNEGVYGLQRAFKLAGARYVLATLWDVDAKATRLFMEEFYKNLLVLKNIRSAFHTTQDWMRQQKEYHDPYYWAGFVLTE